MKVVINSDYGGFGISDEAMELYLTRKGLPFVKRPWRNGFLFGDPIDDQHCFFESDFDRNDPILVQVVEKLGKKANGQYASLRIVEIPDDVEWVLHEYDGIESIHEKHRVWN
jgi:hypothetical protein